jgi:hypothetical protein
MVTSKLTFQEYCVHTAWAALLLFALLMSQPIINSWLNDPSNRYGAYGFGLWFLASVIHWKPFPLDWSFSLTVWIVFGSFCLFLGIIGEFMALIYIGTSCIFLAPIRSLIGRGALLLCAVLWMPVWVWLLSTYFGPNLAVISLVLALIVTLLSLKVRTGCRK